MRINSIFKRMKAFNRPLWFQWSLFPKEGQPPTQSILEIGVYIIIFGVCANLFIDFNRIPESNILIEADKLTDSRFISKEVNNDTTFYLHYQCANLEIKVPMLAEKNDKIGEDGVYNGYLRNDSTRIICLKDISGKYLLKSNLSPYWHAVYDIAARYSKLPPMPNKKFKDAKFRSEFYAIRDGYLKKSYNQKIIDEWKRDIMNMIPDSLNNSFKNFYRIKFSSDIISSISVSDTSWHKVIDDGYPFTSYVFIDQNGNNLLQSYRLHATRDYIEQKKDIQFFSSEFYHANNLTKEMIDKFEKLCFETNQDPMEYLINNRQNQIAVAFSDTVKSTACLRRTLSTARPGWFDRYDISQGWYNLNLNSATIDSIHLTVDFVGATDFYPMKIEPDERGSNYIKFTDPKKIMQIRRDGLQFYAQFKELENRQTIRCFAVTAILSGLLIVIITFLIMGIYRAPHFIRKTTRYDDMQKWLAYQRRHKPNIFDAFFKDMENISDDSIKTIIKDIARYYRLPISMILNKCDTIVKIKTCGEGTECETYYDLKQMEKAGINNTDTFRLTIVHELSHELLRQTRFLLFENEWWIQELAADMMVGAFSATIDDVATGKYLYMLRLQPVSLTHPDGKLRATIVEYGREYITQLRKLGEVDDIQKVLKGLPAFVYEHYQEMQESWNKVQLDDDKENAPVEDMPIG